MLLFALLCGTLWLVWVVYAAVAYRPRRLAGATVVVTGACSEVGRRLCLQLYARGARVVAWDYSRIKLQELQTEVQRLAVETHQRRGGSSSGAEDDYFRTTVVEASSRVQVQRAAKEIDGPVDIIINAAHNFPARPLHDRGDDSVERVLQTNLISPLIVVRQLLPRLFAMKDGHDAVRRHDDYAQVVNIVCASGGYTVATPAPDYAASQWGMVGLHVSMRSWIAHERAAFLQDAQTRIGETRTIAKAGAREVRTTLLCLNDIQNGVPTALHASLAPASAMLGSTATATATTASSPTSPEREDGGSGTRSTRAGGAATSPAPSSSSTREGYTASVLRRSADLDRAVACCIGAMSKGQERYCYTASWSTAVLSPLAMTCPLPWAERILRWLQQKPTPAASWEA